MIFSGVTGPSRPPSVLSAAAFVARRAPKSSQSAVSAAVAMPPIKHVFVIVLENQGFDTHVRADHARDVSRRYAEESRALLLSTTPSGISVSTTTSR